MLHELMPPSERHAPHSYEYADAAAREAATGFVTTDLNKWALQLDDGSYWRLTATTPAWEQCGGNMGDIAAALAAIIGA